MIIKVLDKENIDKEVTKKIVSIIRKKPNMVLGLATGSTPLGVYKTLVETYNKGRVSFKDVKTFNLDEYVGIEDTHEQSYRYFMNTNLFDHIDIDKKNTHFPDNKTKTPETYDEKIKQCGGVDFQVLGIGSNGHIAFNEPNTPFDSLTHIVNLTESTIKDNSRFFNSIDEVPKQAVSMGLKSIMNAKEIILIALGKNKAEAIAKLLKDEPSEALPASILKNHKKVTIYCDDEAASLID